MTEPAFVRVDDSGGSVLVATLPSRNRDVPGSIPALALLSLLQPHGEYNGEY